MAAIIDRATGVLSDLLGLDRGLVPVLLVSKEWARPQAPWQPLDRPVLEQLVVGGPLPRNSGVGGSLAFTIHLHEMADAAWLMIMDHDDGYEPREIVGYVSPQRTCVGVVLAIAVTLGIALASDGKLHEWQLRMDAFADEPVNHPDRFIELSRTPASAYRDNTGFAARCEQFLRQFPRLGGWPRDVSLPG
jgi:hypothetical protein